MTVESIVVSLDVHNEQARGEFEAILTSQQAFRLKNSEDTGFPDLMILEMAEDRDKTFAFIQSVLAASPSTEVLLTAPHTDSDVLLEALRTGVKEFIPQPINRAELERALKRVQEWCQDRKPAAAQPKGGQLINIIGGKGGVGTTTIAVSLATSLLEASSKRSVALVDLNPQFGDVALFLDLAPSHTFGDISKNIARLDPTFLMGILTKHSSGLAVLPSANVVEEVGMLTPEGASKTLELLRTAFDFVIIDSGHSLDDITLSTLHSSTTIFLVTTLTLPVLRNTKRFLDIFTSLGYPAENIKILVNRYQTKNMDVSLNDLENVLKQKPFWLIPNDYFTTLSAINKGEPISSVAKRTEIAKSFANLASYITNDVEKEEKKPSLFSKFFK